MTTVDAPDEVDEWELSGLTREACVCANIKFPTWSLLTPGFLTPVGFRETAARTRERSELRMRGRQLASSRKVSIRCRLTRRRQ